MSTAIRELALLIGIQATGRGTTQRKGTNPRTGEVVMVERRALRVELELPVGDAYSTFLEARLAG